MRPPQNKPRKAVAAVRIRSRRKPYRFRFFPYHHTFLSASIQKRFICRRTKRLAEFSSADSLYEILCKPVKICKTDKKTRNFEKFLVFLEFIYLFKLFLLYYNSVEYLFTLSDNHFAVFCKAFIKHKARVGHLFVIYRYSALLNKPPCFAL